MSDLRGDDGDAAARGGGPSDEEGKAGGLKRGEDKGGDRDRRRRGSRSRSRSRDRRRRSSRSRSRDRKSSRRSRSPRRRSRSPRDRGARSPPRRSSPPKSVPGSGPAAGSDPYAHLRAAAITAPQVDPLAIQRMWQEQQLRARQLVLQQQAISAKSVGSKTQREIYIGNLQQGAVTDAMLTQIFNTALQVRFPGATVPGMEPVVKTNLHSSGKYAFVELRNPDMATAALDLNGQVQFMGVAMSVARPAGFVDPNRATLAAAAASTAYSAFQAGGFPLQALGGPAAAAAAPFALPGPPPLPAGMGAMPPAAPYPGLPMPPPMTGMPQLPPPQALPVQPSLGGGFVGVVYVEGLSQVPTQCLCVLGMVGADVLVSDLDYEEVKEDLKDECDKAAQAPQAVLQVKVPRPPQPATAHQLINTGNYGKAFVLLKDAECARRAREAIDGRTFSSRLIQAAYILPEAYARVV